MHTELERQLADWLSGTDIGLLELRGPQRQVCLLNDAGDVRSVPAGAFGEQSPLQAKTSVPAPCVGRFLHAHPLDDAPLASPGQAVQRGQVIGLLQIGALLLPVHSPHDGRVAGHACADGATVGYGTLLVHLMA